MSKTVRQFLMCSVAVMLSLHGTAQAQFGRGVDVDVNTLLSADAVHSGSTLYAAVEMTLEHGLHVNSNEPLEDYLIPTKVTFEMPEGFSLAETIYPESILVVAGGLDDPLAVYEGTFHIGAAIEVAENVMAGDYEIPVKLRYQACDEKQCYAPKKVKRSLTIHVVEAGESITPEHETIFSQLAFSDAVPLENEVADEQATENGVAAEAEKEVSAEAVLALLDEFEITATAGGYLKPDKFLAFVDSAETGVAQRGLFEGRGPVAILFLILIGGMALNLTPCVLPLIPINLAIIGAGAKAGSRARGFLLGGTYGLGMAFVYGVLGLVVILTAGTFGTINSSPWFNLGIAILFVVLSLAMFDVIVIDFSSLQAKIPLASKGKKGSFLFAFLMGGIAALLAGACVAPVVIQVIVMSSDLYAKGSTLALALPFFLGLGMALPWPIAGAGMSFLPKPGAWMVRVKQAMGVFIIAFAAYYGYLSYELFSQKFVDQEAVAGSAQEMVEEGWTPSILQGLEIAKAENKPVLIDMWATWCKNCLTMDKTTFEDETVVSRLDEYVKIKFQAEDPEAPLAKELLARFDGVGLPTYAILRYQGKSESD